MSREFRGRRNLAARRLLTGVLAATAAVLVASAAMTGAASAAYPGADGLIAFVRGGDIYTIKDTGTGLQRLTSHHHCSGPRWSPSGLNLAYVCHGEVWIADATGSHKTQLTHGARNYRDARPSWAPDGRYLAYVKTKRGAHYGYLTRYDFATHKEVTFSTPYQSESPTARQVKVKALPAAVAWGWALTGGTHGSFILFEGAGTGEFCQPHDYCMDAIGRPHQDQYRNAFPSSEDSGPDSTRLIDPDWFPNSPEFATAALTTQESCSNGACSPTGIDFQFGGSPNIPGAYEAVYAPSGARIAYVHEHDGVPTVYTTSSDPSGTDVRVALTAGTQPDWQPLPEVNR